ncbi:MAG: S41 family peptidase [Blastocatellia bacterium]|nr:S41 family peptidase [Blastocatellia bacterium]
MKKLASVLLYLLVFSCGAAAQRPTDVVIGAAPAAETANELRMKTFDIVWRTVKEKHFDPTLGGVDWEKVRERYQPRAAAAAGDPELYRILQEMLGELGQSHFNIIPPEAVMADEDREPSGSIGIDLRLIEGRAIVTRVDPASAADLAGLRPGFIIRQVGEKPVAQMFEAFSKSSLSPALKTVKLSRRILGEINGDPGSAVKLLYLDGRDQPHEVVIKRERLKGEISPRLGNFPPQYTEFEAKRLAGNIGYIRFNIFTTPVSPKIRAAIASFQDTDGIIIDLRGNPGGVAGIATGMAGQLSDKAGSLGTMKMRATELKFAIFPQANAYTGPLAILIDGLSGSTSEVFSSGMQEIGRAVVIGERSAGACLPSYFQKLPTGALFQFAIADFKTPKGMLVEGRGVSPNIEVRWDRASLLSGRDAQLEAAIGQVRQLQSKSRGVK